MRPVLYEMLLSGQLVPTDVSLTEDAKNYLFANVDMDDEEAVRHVIRHTLVPTYQGAAAKEAAQVKDLLEWYLNCASEEQCEGLFANDPEWPLGYTDPPRLFFQWWWQELFGDEDWRSDRLCDAEVVRGNPPDELRGGFTWPPPIDPDVLKFPRRDGKAPGEGAPTVVSRPE